MLKPSADRAAQAEVDKGTTDIVLVVPGMDTSRLGGILETLVDQLDLHLRQRDDVTQVGISSRQGEGVGQAVVHLRLEDGAERCIELRELAWSDVRPSIGDASIYVRLARGAVLIRYWIGSWILRRMPATSALMRRWTLLMCFSLGIWCALVVAAVSHLLVTSAHDIFSAEGGRQAISWELKAMWLAIIALLGTETLNRGLNNSWGTYAFMTDRDSFRRKTRMRLVGMLAHIAEEGRPAGRTLIVAHSMGTAIAVDALEAVASVADDIPAVDLITLGSPLEFLSLREPSIQEVVERCIHSSVVRKWTDYFDENDAYCSRVPVHAGEGGKLNAHRVNLRRAFSEKLGMRDMHDAYLKLPEVLDLVAGLAPQTAKVADHQDGT